MSTQSYPTGVVVMVGASEMDSTGLYFASLGFHLVLFGETGIFRRRDVADQSRSLRAGAFELLWPSNYASAFWSTMT